MHGKAGDGCEFISYYGRTREDWGEEGSGGLRSKIVRLPENHFIPVVPSLQTLFSPLGRTTPLGPISAAFPGVGINCTVSFSVHKCGVFLSFLPGENFGSSAYVHICT